MVQKFKEVRPYKNKGVVNEGSQALPQPSPRSTPDTRKRLREPTLSQDVSAVKKPVEKTPKVPKKEKEWVEVPARKNLQKKKKKGATVEGIRETRSKDMLVKLKCSKKDRGRLETTFKEVIGVSGAVRHLIHRIEVEIADLEPSIKAEDVEEAVRGFFGQGPEMKLRVFLTKPPYSENRKAYLLLEEVRAIKLLKAAHIKIGWVSCRDHRKKELKRRFCCVKLCSWVSHCLLDTFYRSLICDTITKVFLMSPSWHTHYVYIGKQLGKK